MAPAVEANEGPNPMHIGLLGAQAVVQIAHALAHLIEQTGLASQEVV